MIRRSCGSRVENAVRSSEQQLSRELRYRADYDMLTGIYNKTHFFEATRVLLKRHPEETYAFLRLDIEKFQLVNSFFGSSSGNGLLQYIAKEIRKFAGDTEQIAYGRIERTFSASHAVQGRGGDARACALHAHASWTVPARF